MGGAAGLLVGHDGQAVLLGPLNGGIHADVGIEQADVLQRSQHLNGLLELVLALVGLGDHHAQNLQLGGDALQLLVELKEIGQTEQTPGRGLHGNDEVVGGAHDVHDPAAQGGGRVDEDVIVVARLADLGKTLLQDELSLPHGEEIHLDAAHKNGGGDQIQPLVGGVTNVGGQLLLSLDGGVQVLAALVEAQRSLLVEVGQGEIHLHITVDEQNLLALGDHAVPHVGAGGGLTASALVVGEADYLGLSFRITHNGTPLLKVLERGLSA